MSTLAPPSGLATQKMLMPMAAARAANSTPEKDTRCEFQMASPRSVSQATQRSARCQPADRRSAVSGGCWSAADRRLAGSTLA